MKDDLISRQAVKELAHKQVREKYCGMALKEHRDFYIKLADSIIDLLPSAQPEIIYCKDCQHFVRDDIEEYAPYGFYNTYFHAFCDKHWDKEKEEYIDVKIDDFCSFAERREE